MTQTSTDYKAELKQENFDDNYGILANVLQNLCTTTGRDITIFLPTKQSEVIPYMKKEIIKTLELIKWQ